MTDDEVNDVLHAAPSVRGTVLHTRTVPGGHVRVSWQGRRTLAVQPVWTTGPEPLVGPTTTLQVPEGDAGGQVAGGLLPRRAAPCGGRCGGFPRGGAAMIELFCRPALVTADELASACRALVDLRGDQRLGPVVVRRVERSSAHAETKIIHGAAHPEVRHVEVDKASRTFLDVAVRSRANEITFSALASQLEEHGGLPLLHPLCLREVQRSTWQGMEGRQRCRTWLVPVLEVYRPPAGLFGPTPALVELRRKLAARDAPSPPPKPKRQRRSRAATAEEPRPCS